MKIALVQQNIIWTDPKGNCSHLEELLKGLDNVDLIVFPEMFSTGFVMTPQNIAEEIPSSSVEWMKSLAKNKNCAIAGSISVNDNGKYYNRFYFVKSNGSVQYYDKKHLFSYSGENIAYTAGNKKVIVNLNGVRFLLLVCYDLRFPVWIRNQDDYDVILCVANWPNSRRFAWDILTSARAIENQCYVCGINRIGSDPMCEYDGGTRIVNPFGEVISKCEDNTEGFAIAEIDMVGLEHFREKFPILSDADRFELE